MRTYSPSPTILAPDIPMHSLGSLRGEETVVRRTRRPTIVAPKIALGELGAVALRTLGATTSQVSTAATTALTSVGVTGPVGVAVAAGIAIIGALLAAHAKRLQDAKTENARAATAVSSFYQTMQQIVAAYNSGQVSLSDAISGLQQLDSQTYQLLHSFVGSPGTAWGTSAPGVCNKSCTVGCCLYNTWLHPDIVGVSGMATGILQIMTPQGGQKGAPHGGIPSNKYGFPAMPAQTITVLPASQIPGGGNGPSVTSEVSSAASSLESVVSSLFGGTSTPGTASTDGGTNWLLIGGLALGALLLLR